MDDDATARDLLATVLGYAGHQVQQAADGVEALALAQAKRPDLVIADLLMPTMDGFEFVRQLRENAAFAQTPVVFYTATYLESEARMLASQCGVTHIITKPAEPERILQAVNAVLGVPQAPVAPPPVEQFRQKHLGLLLTKLSQKVETVVPRLDAMIELGLQLASERNPQRLLGSFCGAARKIIGAKYATVGVLDKEDRRLRYVFASGMSAETAARVESPRLPMAFPREILSEQHPLRLCALPGDPQIVGLPNEHPPVHSFLSAPILSPDNIYGWLCLADKVGAAEFNEEDEGLAQTLAALVGRIYENGSLYSEVKLYVEKLEAEAAERKRAQEEIRKLNAELEQRVTERTVALEAANRELEAFAHSVSHDLRAPLRHIDAYTRIVLDQYSSQLPAEARDYLKTAVTRAQLMGRLIEDLLHFSQLGRRPLAKQSVDVASLVEEVLEELRKDQSNRQLDIQVDPLPDCVGDYALLKQVFVNLLSNAFKFTSQRERAVIEVGFQRKDEQQFYFIRDNGAGFDMQYADKLFGVFARLHPTDQFEGTGVGLSIVQRILQRHGGRIWAEAKVNEGATFYFSLPAW